MRWTLLLLAAVLVLVAADASAQCRDCYIDPETACASCVPTNYNAWVLCDVVHNGYACALTGDCTGVEGECRTHNRSDLRPKPEPKLEREWQLVSVEITHVKERKRRS
jgi:hypothetical protein